MENQDLQEQPIAIGAMVQATDGFIGNVIEIMTDGENHELSGIVVENDQQNKKFTIPVNMIEKQVGTHVVHLNISNYELQQQDVDMEVDTETGNIGHPDFPISMK